MTKGSEIYAGLQIYNWVTAQDFPTKFSKLSKKLQADYEAVAAKLTSDKAKEEPIIPPKPEASPDKIVKKRKATGYSIYKARLIAYNKEKGSMKIPAAEMLERYSKLEPGRRDHFVAAAAEMNKKLEEDLLSVN
jgi:hypothetical protein